MDDTHAYPNLRDEDVITDFFEGENNVSVETPTIPGILADKLVAFAPETVGIPYEQGGERQSLRLIKQLHDVAILFENVESIEKVMKAYQSIHEKQCEYIEFDGSIEDSLKDSIEAARLVSLINSPNKESNEKMQILEDGIESIQSHVFDSRLARDQAVSFASRLAYIATLLLNPELSFDIKDERYDSSDIEDLRDSQIEGSFEELNHLKRRNPEAFYYWYEASKLL